LKKKEPAQAHQEHVVLGMTAAMGAIDEIPQALRDLRKDSGFNYGKFDIYGRQLGVRCEFIR